MYYDYNYKLCNLDYDLHYETNVEKRMNFVYNGITNKCNITTIYMLKEGIAMAEQVLIQFRADKELKQEVAEIYETLGMDLPTAFRMFMTRSKMVKGLPFEATLPESAITRMEAKKAFYELREQAVNLPDMTIDEINAEIAAVRAERKGKC